MAARLSFIFALVVVCTGCIGPSHHQIQLALNHTNRVWKAENQEFTREHGTRFYQVSPKLAFTAAVSTLNSLGFSIEGENRQCGTIYAVAQAPSPLTEKEWQRARNLDESEWKKILEQYIGDWANEARLHVDGVEIHVIGAILPKKEGCIVGFTFILIDHKMSAMGFTPPRNPPPHLTKLAVHKAWRLFDDNIKWHSKK